MVSTEFAAPKTYFKGFEPKDVEAGRYGTSIHLWDWKERKQIQSVKVDDGTGGIPLEVRFLHDTARPVGFVGVALSSAVWWIGPAEVPGGPWRAKKVIQVEPIMPTAGLIPGLITDILVSMDDRFLYFSNWLHGDVRQYDISNPLEPKLVGQLFVGGLPGLTGKPTAGEPRLSGGPQMLQLSLDGKRLYVTDSLLSVWDNGFYPEMAKKGSRMFQIDCDTDKGGLTLNRKFVVDFGQEADGPSRAHEVRYPGGDCSSDIFS
jgi:selenium-binding protein 1